jgi:endonuclease/exonuclease/phosphatase family metal-dependent hydrolase
MKLRDEQIILAGDFNESLDAGTSNMSKICQDIGLSDVFSIRHPDIPEPATYIRGSRRIDYFLVSATVLASVETTLSNSVLRLTTEECSLT